MTDDIGKWFEGKVYTALQEIQSKYLAMAHHFPDTKSARNLLPAQPGDHFLLVPGMSMLIEEKCSAVHASLRAGFSSLWNKRQAAFHRKWHRAGHPSWVMFCNYQTDQVEIWRGEDIAMARSKGERIAAEAFCFGASIETLEQDILRVLEIEVSRKGAPHGH